MPEHPSITVEVVPGGRVDGSIRPPGSKSLTNRALICAAFARSSSTLRGALKSEDTEVMAAALRSIGIGVEEDDGGCTLRVTGLSDGESKHRFGSAPTELFIANSGTSVRFLTAALSAWGGSFRLIGVDRMHQRPIGDLVDAIGPVVNGNIAAESDGGCPPVRIDSRGWSGADLSVAGSVSSQYLSGLMMAAPIAMASASTDRSMQIAVHGELVSRPYVDMTAEVMRTFGAEVRLIDDPPPAETKEAKAKNVGLMVQVGGRPYVGCNYEIEPDASAASYFWAAAAISGGRITVEGLSTDAMQGDVGFCDVLSKMGCKIEHDARSLTVTGQKLVGIDVDMNAISDTVQTLSVVALFADGPTRIRGVAHNRFKETDRIGDLARELRKLGAEIQEHEDGMTIVPPQQLSMLHGARLETYHDHRMAMSLSLAGLRVEGVKILNPACTAKTYPDYFSDLEQLLGRPHRWSSRE